MEKEFNLISPIYRKISRMRDIQIFILPLLPFWICLCILGIHF